MATRGRAKSRNDPAAAAVAEGWRLARAHPMLAPIAEELYPQRIASHLPPSGWAYVSPQGFEIAVHNTRLAPPDEWQWVFAHLILHVAFGHGTSEPSDAAERAAREVEVYRFHHSLRIGQPPWQIPADLPSGSVDDLAKRWRREGIPLEFLSLGVCGDESCVHITAPGRWRKEPDWQRLFAIGLTDAVSAALDVAGGARSSLTDSRAKREQWELARQWFITSYPLLGAAMSTLTLVSDAQLAKGWDISIAAVDPVAGELYVNPLAVMSQEEWRFVLAHEALHAALNHHTRLGGRDPYLFNLAADFVINDWLVEMGVGVMPEGVLHDPSFRGKSAEEVYDIIAAEARMYRKLATLRGRDNPDIFGHGARPARPGYAVDLDELLRRSLLTGFDAHIAQGRGTLPAALVAEIRTLAQPAPRWDVELAHWFEEHFPALEPSSTYARPSRRQAATPDIPRPAWHNPEELTSRRTFGVVLDTSGSMSAELLGKALGAIASYAKTHDVPAARVMFCDAVSYDAGYLDVDEIAGRVRVRGRGGTVLQPGVDALERASDFPPDGPILIITDGDCDVLRLRREHAFLLPAGRTLPFRPRGPVFRFE